MMSNPEEVEVRVEPVGDTVHEARPDDGEAAPTMFVRGGRLYVVRRVLSRWSGRSGLRQGLAPEGATVAGDRPAAGGRLALADEAQEALWRVEASPGRGLGSATYDLIRHPETSTRGATWTLLAVAD